MTQWRVEAGVTSNGVKTTRIEGRRTIGGRLYGQAISIPAETKIQASKVASLKRLVDTDLDSFEHAHGTR